jgi:hypothetical protein
MGNCASIHAATPRIVLLSKVDSAITMAMGRFFTPF